MWSFYVPAPPASPAFIVSVDGGAGSHGQLYHYTIAGATFVLRQVVTVDTDYGIYSIAGRVEPFAGSGVVVYAASQRAVYRVNMTSYSISVIHTAATGEVVRGVALPPL